MLNTKKEEKNKKDNYQDKNFQDSQQNNFQQELDKIRQEKEEYLAGWKRAKADYENLKKELSKEKENYIKYANLNLITELIPVYKNLTISFNHLPDEIKENPWVKGIEHVTTQFKQVLSDNGIKEINPKPGDDFDPQIHEAVEETDNKQENKQEQSQKQKIKIKKIISPGYKMQDKVFMPAKVVVE